MSRGASRALAVAATGTALCLSLLAGWQRGGSSAERLVWVAIGVVLVACAHLLPALVRGASAGVRGVAAVLWLACMAAACLGHATFFVLAQRHAGELRMLAAPVPEPAAANRSLTAVMTERAEVVARLATITTQRCSGNCPTLEARRVTLTARLAALDAEVENVRRSMAERDRATAQRDARLTDPVTARLAALLGTTVVRVELLTALTFAAVLEGIACLLWTLTLVSRQRSETPVAPSHALAVAPAGPLPAAVACATDVTAPPVTAVTLGAVETAGSHAPHDAPVTPHPPSASHDPDVTQLVQAIATGQLRPTVNGIRQFLGCSQARAIALRRRLAELASAA
ncbi:hypothetical protein PI87_02830 [Ralstonia sp. A12]|uniref:hypothetical protein n=1 Tax=Ralstonia sp. A12 TaxID=1217052 RepID=UPI000573F7E7|nr:hypothetical protein [Ralstonia sp. A12]KHK58691.1 hypothetical protein PI87_02830 [Ralstonia sp. A12]